MVYGDPGCYRQQKFKTPLTLPSDNGPHLEGGADPAYFDSHGPFRGYKRDLYEGHSCAVHHAMVRPDPRGVTSSTAAVAWLSADLCIAVWRERAAGIQGVSLLPLLGKGKHQHHKFLNWKFHKRGGSKAIREGNGSWCANKQ